MYRLVSFIVIFSLVTLLLFIHFEYGHNPFSSSAQDHHYEMVEIPSDHVAPSIKGTVNQDHSGTWYVHIETENFNFSPENVGLEGAEWNEGHAHLYLNGKRINRMYGNYYNLGELKKGTYNIMVTLNANNHGILSHAGEPLIYEETFEVLE